MLMKLSLQFTISTSMQRLVTKVLTFHPEEDMNMSYNISKQSIK